MADSVYDDCWLVMSEYGIQRMTKRSGKLNKGERSVRIRLVMPKSAFVEPDISATVTVPDGAIFLPPVSVDVVFPNEQSK